MDDPCLELFTCLSCEGYNSRRGMEWKEAIDRLFLSFWICGTCPHSRCERTKLKDKSVSCVLLGVSNESKGHRMFDLVTKRIL